jgi:hypothetical protein
MITAVSTNASTEVVYAGLMNAGQLSWRSNLLIRSQNRA